MAFSHYYHLHIKLSIRSLLCALPTALCQWVQQQHHHHQRSVSMQLHRKILLRSSKHNVLFFIIVIIMCISSSSATTSSSHNTGYNYACYFHFYICITYHFIIFFMHVMWIKQKKEVEEERGELWVSCLHFSTTLLYYLLC